jgi:hypothetical protein
MLHWMFLRLAVSICLTVVIVGCGEAKAPAPEMPPSPAALASPPPQPKPLPPEERETKVLPVDSKNCGATDTTYIDHTIAEVLARCVVTAPTTRVVLTVVSRATDPADYLQALSQRFCGQVIDATGPAGWRVAIEREKGLSGEAADVAWESPPSALNGHATARRISDFSVTLRGPWRTGSGHSVVFTQTTGPSSGSPHDCPYPFR